VDVDEGDGLGADVPAAEGVRRVAAHRDDLLAARSDLEAAQGLAQVAGAIGDAVVGVEFSGTGALRTQDNPSTQRA
jgi:hypothetical protein